MEFGKKISGSKAKQIVDRGALLIDTRDPVSFRDGTLTGASNVSLRNISSLLKHPRTTPLVFFGSGDDNELQRFVSYAVQMGFNKVFALGSIDNWTE